MNRTDGEAQAGGRGDETRQALVGAALDVFGRDGFHAASTRAIAKRAGVNQALIGYHFGGKEGLYLAVFEHITERMAAQLGTVADAMTRQLDEAGPEGELPSAERAERYLPFLHRLTDAAVVMMARRETDTWARLILREQQEPSAAFDILYRGIMGRLLALATVLVARVRGTSPGDEEARMLALTIVGQMLVFRLARAAVLRHMGWAEVGPAQVAAIQARVRANVRAMLMAPPAAPEVSS